MRRLSLALFVALSTGWGAACYTGFGSVGAFCEDTADCGPDQACENSICGVCRNEIVEAGELCLAPPDELQLGAAIKLMNAEDFDGDGDTDLVVATNSNCVTLMSSCWYLHRLTNRGDGSMDSSVSDPFPGAIDSVSVGLFDDDEYLDATFTIEDSSDIVVVLDIFSGEPTPALLSAPGVPRSVRAVDLNRDGAIDIAVGADAPALDASLFIFDGDGAGNFAPFRGVVAGANAWVGPARDLDEDGDDDLVVANIGLDQISVLLNDGSGDFEIAQELAAGQTPTFVEIDDLDADGDLDLAVVNTADSSLSVYRGAGDGSFSEAETVATGPAPVFVAAADINADEATDLLVANAQDDKLSIFLGREDGFPDEVEYDVSSTPVWIIPNDFNGDDVLDLAVGAGSLVSFSFAEP